MMEELVAQLARLQADRKVVEDDITDDHNICDLVRVITILESQIAEEREKLVFLRAGYDTRISEIDIAIETIKAQIVEVWNGEKKTMQYPAGILKFRTSQSLKIRNETLVLTGLLDHTSVVDVATKYIKGFNLTAVKKYMSVLDLPMGAAEIEHNTTVKLDLKGSD